MGRVQRPAEFETRYVPDPVSGCWLWLDGLNSAGYGKIKYHRHTYGAHRHSWVIHRGEIPPGMWVLHHCDTPSCVNPDHLFLGTVVDNNRDRAKKGRYAQAGEDNNQAKLTKEQALAIRSDIRSLTKIALDYGVFPSAISRIKNRKRWAHI